MKLEQINYNWLKKEKNKLKTQIQSLEGEGEKIKEEIDLFKNSESTIRDIEELNKYKDIKEGNNKTSTGVFSS